MGLEARVEAIEDQLDHKLTEAGVEHAIVAMAAPSDLEAIEAFGRAIAAF